MRKYLFLAPFVAAQIFGVEVIGIVGGNSAPDGFFAALVQEDAVMVPVSLFSLPLTTAYSVDIGESRHALIGGYAVMGPVGYAALLLPGSTTAIDLVGGTAPMLTGRIIDLSINDTGFGMIGGYTQGAPSQFFGRMVTPTGSLTPFSNDPISPPLSTGGSYNSVSINNNGNGIVGGIYQGVMPGPAVPNSAFAGLVSSSGVVKRIDLPFTAPTNRPGQIISVAINNQDFAIIGGFARPGANSIAVAAFVNPSGIATNISPISIALNESGLDSVDINESGNGLIVGNDYTVGLGYAAFVSSSLTLTEFDLTGICDYLAYGAINNSGVGIIGGQNLGDPFAAFIYQDHTINLINLNATGGLISQVDIADTGLALVAGDDSVGAFAALITPDLTVTRLIGVDSVFGQLASASLCPDAIEELLTPTSSGPYQSVLNSSLSVSNALNSHISVHHKRKYLNEEFDKRTNVAALITDAAFGEKPNAGSGGCISRSARLEAPIGDADPEPQIYDQAPQRIRSKEGGYTAYLFPFYERAKQASHDTIPALSNDIIGALAAIEYTTVTDMVFGAGLSYAYNYAHYSNQLGHANINQEMAVVYASFNHNHLFANLSLWGGLYQLENERHTPFISVTSTLKTSGWIFDPHLELSYTWNNEARWFYLETFGMADWVNNWQKHATEKGSAGLNLVLGSEHNSLLRSEAGFRFYESLKYCWGTLLLTEKASYINRTPFGFGSVNTFFVGGGDSAFTVENGTTETQNLGGVQLNVSFIPRDDAYPYGAIDFQGEFGSTFQSYFFGFEVGKKF